MESVYVLKTDKGYLKGDLYHGVEFVDKNAARTFSYKELAAYFDSIAADMFDFFQCKEICSEQLT